MIRYNRNKRLVPQAVIDRRRERLKRFITFLEDGKFSDDGIVIEAAALYLASFKRDRSFRTWWHHFLEGHLWILELTSPRFRKAKSEFEQHERENPFVI